MTFPDLVLSKIKPGDLLIDTDWDVTYLVLEVDEKGPDRSDGARWMLHIKTINGSDAHRRPDWIPCYEDEFHGEHQPPVMLHIPRESQ